MTNLDERKCVGHVNRTCEGTIKCFHLCLPSACTSMLGWHQRLDNNIVIEGMSITDYTICEQHKCG